MSIPAGSRQKVLDRIRAATPAAAKNRAAAEESYAAIPRPYVEHGELGTSERVALMIERLREYDTEVVDAQPEDLPDVIRAQLAASNRHTFVAPAGLPAVLMPAGFDWKIDRDLTAAEIERAEGVMTAAFCGIADSGTIVLHHSSTEGRRVLTLLPDWHLCVLRASQVVETLPEYFRRCQLAPAVATYITGPSATADIEMTRIKGVHGPRFLSVVLVRDQQ